MYVQSLSIICFPYIDSMSALYQEASMNRLQLTSRKKLQSEVGDIFGEEEEGSRYAYDKQATFLSLPPALFQGICWIKGDEE